MSTKHNLVTSKNNENYNWIIFILGVIGFFDAAYLTYKHYDNSIVPCSTNLFIDCGKVLESQYAVMFGFPLAAWGMLFYATVLTLAFVAAYMPKHYKVKMMLFYTTVLGMLFSVYLVYLQLVVIQSICLYCMLSAFTSISLYVAARFVYIQDYRRLFLTKSAVLYKYFVKPVLFQFDPEFIHNRFMLKGNLLGTFALTRTLARYFHFYRDDKYLKQHLGNAVVHLPVGLSAGFDYEANITQITPEIGFGFHTVGTITNLPYQGNEKPRLGRLPKSKALLVNKGYKNLGADATIQKLEQLHFKIPIGISIGQSNRQDKIKTVKDAVEDIKTCFLKFEQSKVKHKYYELNISCPNLNSDIHFYEPSALKQLLDTLVKLKITRPVLAKMPIELDNKHFLAITDTLSSYHSLITGIIIGNLQKNRTDETLDQDEVSKWKRGNFSGKPTFKRSNELITLARKTYNNRFIIVGCGGIFSAEDAYEKFKAGATFVQLITGMIFEGPQLITSINRGIVEMMKNNGIKHVSEIYKTKP